MNSALIHDVNVCDCREGLLDAPPAVIKRGKLGRRISGGIEERGHEHMNQSLRRHDPNQPHRSRLQRAAILGRIARIGRSQAHDLLVKTRG